MGSVLVIIDTEVVISGVHQQTTMGDHLFEMLQMFETGILFNRSLHGIFYIQYISTMMSGFYRSFCIVE